MKNMTIRNIAAACGGSYHGPKELLDKEITAVTTDSRTASEGCLYVPIKGARVDGHDFIPDVMAAGALVTLSVRAEGVSAFPYILVKNTEEALQQIAGFYRREMGIPVVGITGSVGKTSTKEMIAAVLAQKFRVLKTEGNLNSNVGLPLMIFRMTKEHEIAVLEMGISHFGEMTWLAETAEPDTMVITNIGTCHLEFLKDRDGVFKAKTECFDYVKLDGTVILNGEDDKLAQVQDVHGKRPVFYGFNPHCRVQAENLKPLGLHGTKCTISIDDESFDVTVPLPGSHMVLNALAAAAVGSAYGLSFEEIRAGIESVEPLSGRLNIVNGAATTLIDDCYNANPMSMKASLSVLHDIEGGTTAILGDMGELGETERELHRSVGEYAAPLKIDRYVIIGDLAKEITKGLKEGGCSAEIFEYGTVEDALKDADTLVRKGDTVLVKASRFMKFERIVDILSKGGSDEEK